MGEALLFNFFKKDIRTSSTSFCNSGSWLIVALDSKLLSISSAKYIKYIGIVVINFEIYFKPVEILKS